MLQTPTYLNYWTKRIMSNLQMTLLYFPHVEAQLPHLHLPFPYINVSHGAKQKLQPLFWQRNLFRKRTCWVYVMIRIARMRSHCMFLWRQTWKMESGWTGWAVSEPRLHTKSPLSHLQSSSPQHTHRDTSICIWNPSQRTSVVLSLSSTVTLESYIQLGRMTGCMWLYGVPILSKASSLDQNLFRDWGIGVPPFLNFSLATCKEECSVS